MKRNWMQIVSLTLTAVLAAAVLWQGGRLEALERQLEEGRQTSLELVDRLTEAETALESTQMAAEPQVMFADPRVAVENRMLTVDLTVVMPENARLLSTVGFCTPGEHYSTAWELLYLQRSADNRTYTAAVTIPLDLETGLELRTEDDTVLYTTDSMLDLLPLQLSYGEVSWHYDSREEIFYQGDDWTASFQDPSGGEAEAVNGAFHVYRNGELVFTGRETEERFRLEADGEPVEIVRLACALGDRMRLTYTCEDAFGLCYEFPLQEQVALAWDDMRSCPLSHAPIVTWPS